jgi:lysophospholipase L1-like esterase
MHRISHTAAIRRIARLALLAIASAAAICILLLAAIWLGHLLSTAVLVKAELLLLATIEIIYAATAVLSFSGFAILALVWVRGRRRGDQRPAAARLLVLTGSLLCGVVLAEATSAAWQTHRFARTAMPVGGLSAADDPRSMWRIPASLELPRLPTEFADPPGDPVIDIAVLGESSAEGVPFQRWLSVGKIVGWQLEKAIPARPVRLSVLARSGDTLEAQHHELGNLKYRPELLIVYCGHNEFASRLFWSRDRHYYLDADQPDWLHARIERVEQLSSVCRLIREESDQCMISLPPEPKDRRNLIDLPAYTRVEYTALLADFHHRLEAIVKYGQDLGALVVLIAPPGNDAGYDPNRSSLPAATPRSEREAFGRAVLAARRLEARDLIAAVAEYRRLVAAQPTFAETHYRLALLLEQSAKWDEAYQHYVAARDLDGYPQRILTAFQEVYREVAARHDCILIDGQTYFHSLGHHGLLDDDLFQDAMHPSLRGEIGLAQAVLHALQARRAFGWPSDHPAPIIDPGRCAAHFGIVAADWRNLCEWCVGFNNLVAPLRYESGQRARKRQRYVQAVHRLISGDSPESLELPNIGIPRPVPLVGEAEFGAVHAAHRSAYGQPAPLGGIREPQENGLRSGVPGSRGGG